MLDSKNKIGDIKNSNIGSIEQTNIEKQENNITNNNITKKQVNLIVTGGDFTEVALSHNLFPDYIVATKKMHNGKYTLVSKPTSEEALKKYPYNFKSSFRVIDERYKNIKDPDLLLDMIQYADSPVEVEITKFEQYLGNVIDPYPNPEFSPMQEGTKSYIIPKKRKLPKIEFNVDIEFENSNFKLKNIKLKLTKQLSSKIFILDNYAQKNLPVFIQLELEFVNAKELKCKLNYKINEEKAKSSKALYTYNLFVLNFFKNKYSMYDRQKRKTILAGKVKSDKKEAIKNIESYLQLINMIIQIEKYFNVEFDIPKEIPRDDVDTIESLYKKIMESKKRIRALDFSFSVLKKDTDRDYLKPLLQPDNMGIIITYKDVIYNILGKDIKINEILEKYEGIKCYNKEEVKNFIDNYDSLKEDYELRIKMIPTKGKKFYKYTKIIKDEAST